LKEDDLEDLRIDRQYRNRPIKAYLNRIMMMIMIIPDIIIRDNEKGTCMLIDVAISGDKKCD